MKSRNRLLQAARKKQVTQDDIEAPADVAPVRIGRHFHIQIRAKDSWELLFFFFLVGLNSDWPDWMWQTEGLTKIIPRLTAVSICFLFAFYQRHDTNRSNSKMLSVCRACRKKDTQKKRVTDSCGDRLVRTGGELPVWHREDKKKKKKGNFNRCNSNRNPNIFFLGSDVGK